MRSIKRSQRIKLAREAQVISMSERHSKDHQRQDIELQMNLDYGPKIGNDPYMY